MKKLFTILIFSGGLCVAALAQGPGAVPPSSPMPTAPTVSAISPTVSPSPIASPDSSTLAGRIHNKVSKNLHNKGIHFDFDGDDDSGAALGKEHHSDEVPEMVVPIVALVMFSVFGAPVLIVAIILLTSAFREAG